MRPIPAIDVLDRRVVRLRRGDFDAVTVYSDDPAGIATGYVAAGADRLHLVDLNGARSGALDLALIQRVAEVVPDLQVGGGIRTPSDGVSAIDAGASRVVVGSMAVHDAPGLIDLIGSVGGGRVVVAVDVRDGKARGSGWLDDGESVRSVVERAVDAGCGSLLVTGIDRDGTMAGPDLDLLGSVRSWAPAVEIIASGGIATLDDLDRASATGADAAVVGRALLDGAFTIQMLMERFGDP